MSKLFVGKVQAGFGDAARWLKLFNAAYSQKLGMSVIPGSLNIVADVSLRNHSACKMAM